MNRADYALLVAPAIIGAVTWSIAGSVASILPIAYTTAAVVVSAAGLGASRHGSAAAN